MGSVWFECGGNTSLSLSLSLFPICGIIFGIVELRPVGILLKPYTDSLVSHHIVGCRTFGELFSLIRLHSLARFLHWNTRFITSRITSVVHARNAISRRISLVDRVRFLATGCRLGIEYSLFDLPYYGASSLLFRVMSPLVSMNLSAHPWL